MIYTQLEQTVKKYKLKDAIDAAAFILKEKNIRQVNLTSVMTTPRDTKITLEELNQISDKIVASSY